MLLADFNFYALCFLELRRWILGCSEEHAEGSLEEEGGGKESFCTVPDIDIERFCERSLGWCSVCRLVDVQHCTADLDVHSVRYAGLDLSERQIVCNVQGVEVSPERAFDGSTLVWAPDIL